MCAALRFLVLFAAAASSATVHPNLEPIPIAIFYETLCPDSIRFINKKLIPTYSQSNFNFASLLTNLTLVPYGHVKVINARRYQYSCQHGQAECDGNKLHGCAVKYFTDKRKLLDYIGCLLNTDGKSSYSPYPVNECRDKIPKDLISLITKCYNTNEGWDLFNEHGVSTNSFLGPTKYFVPYISFYNIKDDKISENANNDFRKTLCLIYGLRDHLCTDDNA